MDEMNVMPDEVTMPTEGTADDVGTTPTDTTADTAAEGQPEDTTPTDPATAEDAHPTEEPPAEEAPSEPFTVRFRHRDVELTREDATAYAQKGLLYTELQPTIDTLRRLAAGAGKSVAELVASIAEANEKAMKERFLREAHGDTSVAERLMQVERTRLQAAYDSSIAAEKEAEETATRTLNERLATEFCELQAEFPNLKEFKDIPQAVVNEAINKNKSLVDVYLRYHFKEQKKIAANNASRQAAAAASVGSKAANPPTETVSPVMEAMLAGVYNR